MMKEFVENHMDEMLEMLKELVNTDSGSHDKAGVDHVGHMLREKYEKTGFVTDVRESEQYGNSLVLRHQDAVDPDILILAHMDTVFPKGTAEQRPFSIKNGRAYGPGVIDMQPSHVLILYALNALKDEQIPVYKNVEIVLNSDEELGTISSRSLIEERAKGKKYALVMEPARPDGSIVSSRRGAGRYELTVKGKAAHSGMNPADGVSAIDEIAHKVIELKALADPDNGVHINVGLIEGGTSVNTIAPMAKAEIDVRITKAEQGDVIDQKIRDVCEKSAIAGTELTLTGGINRPPMEFTESTKALVDTIQAEAKKLGLNVGHIATGGGSDASFTAAMGVPTVDGLGPVGGNQHTEEEYLIVDTLTERTILFANVLQRLSTT